MTPESDSHRLILYMHVSEKIRRTFLIHNNFLDMKEEDELLKQPTLNCVQICSYISQVLLFYFKGHGD